MNWTERLYRRALHLYPAAFRRRYGDDMVAALRARRADPRSSASFARRVRFYWIVAEDLARSVPREHRLARRIDSRTPRSDWTMDTLRQDLRFAVRTLLARPAFSLVVVLTLALGIGATTTIFSVVDGVVLRALPYPDDDRLVMLGSQSEFFQEFGPVSPYAFDQWREAEGVFTGIAASHRQDMNLTGEGDPERIQVAGVSPEYFHLLGVTPRIGRGLLAEDDRPGATRVAVAGYGLWQRQWGGDASLLGGSIVLDGVSYTVVGVLPRDFLAPEAMGHGDVELWIPLRQTAIDMSDSGNFVLRVLARMQPQIGIDGAREAMAALAWTLNVDHGSAAGESRALAGPSVPGNGSLGFGPAGDGDSEGVAETTEVTEQLPEPAGGNAALGGGDAQVGEPAAARGVGVRLSGDGIEVVEPDEGIQVAVVSLKARTVGDSGKILVMLGGAVAFLLLIACANVAHLLLTRAQDRSREIAVRAALGAGQGRLIRQLLTESGLVALAGGALGAGLAVLGVGLFLGLNPGDLPRLQQVGVDTRVLLFTLGVSLATGVAFGLVPALQLAREASSESLKEAAPGSSHGGRHQRFRSSMVALETALALVLLIGAGLLINSFVRLTSIDPGFEPSNLVVMRVELGDRYSEPGAQTQFFRQLLGRVEALPAVVRVGATSLMPFTDLYTMSTVEAENPISAPEGASFAGFHQVSAGFHDALGVRFLHGRGFLEQEESDPAAVVVVDPTFASKYWGRTDVVGRRLRFGTEEEGETWKTVVGVIADLKQFGLRSPENADVYLPFRGGVGGKRFHVAARLSTGAGAAGPALREAVWALDRSIPVDEMFTMREAIAGSVDEPRFYAVVLGVFAASALVLAAVGIAGTVAYSTARRYHEIGIRRALGAGRRALVLLVARQGLTAVLVGLVAGTVGAYWLSSALGSFVFGIEPTDPATFAVVAAALLAVAACACLLPARRATRVDPVVALRSD